MLLFIKVWADYKPERRVESLTQLYEKLEKPMNKERDKVIVFACSGLESSNLYFYDPEVGVWIGIRIFTIFFGFSRVLYHFWHQLPITFAGNVIFAQPTTRFTFKKGKKFASMIWNLVPGASFTSPPMTLLQWSYFTN